MRLPVETEVPNAKTPIVVDVWRMETAAASADRWEHYLSDAERRQASRFLRAGNRRDYTAAHALTRRLLAARGLGAPAAIELIRGAHGKPHLRETEAGDWRFSLTHTEGFVAVAAAQGVEVGIDAEGLDRTIADADLERTVLTPAERASLNGLQGAAWRHAFFRLWTLKEAVVKMIGTGLSTSLLSVQVLGDPPFVTFARDVANAPEQCFLHTETPTPHHVESLGVASAGRPVEIRRRSFDAEADWDAAPL